MWRTTRCAFTLNLLMCIMSTTHYMCQYIKTDEYTTFICAIPRSQHMCSMCKPNNGTAQHSSFVISIHEQRVICSFVLCIWNMFFFAFSSYCLDRIMKHVHPKDISWKMVAPSSSSAAQLSHFMKWPDPSASMSQHMLLQWLAKINPHIH